MLPGFRFLFGAIVLLVSILVFGFGAAALLRTAHEEFASAPAWRPAPETRFAQADQPTQPVLALLRVDDPPKDAGKDAPAALNDVPANAVAEPVASPEPDLDKTAAPQPADAPPSEAAKPETETAQDPVLENPPQAKATAAPTDAPSASDQGKVATTEQQLPADVPAQVTGQATAPVTNQAIDQTPADATRPSETAPAPAAEVAPSVPAQASVPDPASFSTRIATLGGPPVTIAAPTKDADVKHERNVIRKRQAHRAAHRRRVALRRLQQQQAAQQQQLNNPFTPLQVAR
ncbi:MAG TPA: hypothetical protein VGM09_13650 [Bradyrhizobium sp.]